MKYAEVILPLALPRNYTYHVPEGMDALIRPGMRVAVQFAVKKKYAALVSRLHDERPGNYATKPILQLLDEEPILYAAQLKFWNWLASYYMCTEGEVMNAALPARLKLSSETILIFNGAYGEEFGNLDEDEYLVAEALSIKKELTVGKVQELLDKASVFGVIRRLMEKGICLIQEDLRESFRIREENFITLDPRYMEEEQLKSLFEEMGKAPKQLELLMAFLHLKRTQGEVKQTELLEKSGAKYAQLKGLMEKKVLLPERRRLDRVSLAYEGVREETMLSEDQGRCYDRICSLFTEKPVVLLQGVTSSGKTLVYIRLIADYLQQGKQVLYLLPEIALTAQIIRRLQRHFGEKVGVYHSRFSDNERVELWQKVKSGEIRVILGARSALLLPFGELGLIILDEEHDSSFKQQEPAPRYHARDAAIYYAGVLGARVLLGSATPSLESYHHALSGKYGLAELKERFGGSLMPEMVLVNALHSARSSSSQTFITPELQAEITRVLAQDKQVILFQNRRGFAPCQVCTTCGWINHCAHCEVSLTYHKLREKLQCHYCGRQYPLGRICGACGSPTLVLKGFGTEKVEDDIISLFPSARVARMDVDSIRSKHGHQKLIHSFEQRRVDILVGTQMVVKGLDFDHVALVGILNADSLLNFPDFRSGERAFQIMEQVSGRAGRKENRGKVIIQTLNPKHPILEFVLHHDYRAMYEAEIEHRRQFRFPPFFRLVRITLKHKNQQLAEEASRRLFSLLPPAIRDSALGPAAPYISRIRNYYIFELLFRLPLQSAQIILIKKQLKEAFQSLHEEKKFSRVFLIPDVDVV